MDKHERLRLLTQAEVARKMPRTMQDWCRLTSRVAVAVGAVPDNDRDILNSALGMVEGLFGEEYACATYAQKVCWIDMCEVELRAALADHKRRTV